MKDQPTSWINQLLLLDFYWLAKNRESLIP